MEEEETVVSSLRRFLRLPCRHREEGCTAMVLGDQLEEHQRTCPVGWKRCPFSRSGACTWSGTEDDAISHCLEVHGNKLLVGSKLEYTWRFFSGLQEEVEHVMLAYGQLFLWRLRVDKASDTIKWTCDPLVEGGQRGIMAGIQYKSRGFQVKEEIAVAACDLRAPPQSASWREMLGSFIACKTYARKESMTFVFLLYRG